MLKTWKACDIWSMGDNQTSAVLYRHCRHLVKETSRSCPGGRTLSFHKPPKLFSLHPLLSMEQIWLVWPYQPSVAHVRQVQSKRSWTFIGNTLQSGFAWYDRDKPGDSAPMEKFQIYFVPHRVFPFIWGGYLGIKRQLRMNDRLSSIPETPNLQ